MMACRRIGDTPLSKPMVTEIFKAWSWLKEAKEISLKKYLWYEKNVACLSSCLRGGPQHRGDIDVIWTDLDSFMSFLGMQVADLTMIDWAVKSDRQQRRRATPTASECMQMGERPRQRHVLKCGTPDHTGIGGDKLQFCRYVEKFFEQPPYPLSPIWNSSDSSFIKSKPVSTLGTLFHIPMTWYECPVFSNHRQLDWMFNSLLRIKTRIH